jgi:hypothetical protein
VDRLGAKFEDERVSLASSRKMQTMPLGVAVGNSIHQSDTTFVQDADHPRKKFFVAHSQGVVWFASTGFTLFQVEISSYTQFLHGPTLSALCRAVSSKIPGSRDRE